MTPPVRHRGTAESASFRDRLLAESVRALEHDGSRPIDAPDADAQAAAIEGDFETRLIARARVVASANALEPAMRNTAQVFRAILALGLLISPGLRNALVGIVIILLIASNVVTWTHTGPIRLWHAMAIGVLIAAVALNLAGRTDSPWCDPSTLLQAHAGWHVLAAVFLGLYFMASASTRSGIGVGMS